MPSLGFHPIKYSDLWSTDPNCSDVVRKTWQMPRKGTKNVPSPHEIETPTEAFENQEYHHNRIAPVLNESRQWIWDYQQSQLKKLKMRSLETLVHRGNCLTIEVLKDSTKKFALVRSCLAFCEATIPSVSTPVKQLILYLETAEVALISGLVSHADGLLDSAMACLQSGLLFNECPAWSLWVHLGAAGSQVPGSVDALLPASSLPSLGVFNACASSSGWLVWCSPSSVGVGGLVGRPVLSLKVPLSPAEVRRCQLADLLLAKDDLAILLGVNKFQVLRDLMENYLASDIDSSFCDQPVSSSVVPETSFEVGTPFHYSLQKSPKELMVYTRRKKHRKEIVVDEIGLDSPLSEDHRGDYLFS
ncbi:hypothetical protein Cgig2_019528 [Carnegiea gigantea]|uniref:Uncharacterized protein n=1 Tax=Carnegiea gigantea TaxID=171969 RepID=A0A9Q1KG67_9CARY|nr:hypothetical protein Cgig2_019528 [Carnegiea gigantea]